VSLYCHYPVYRQAECHAEHRYAEYRHADVIMSVMAPNDDWNALIEMQQNLTCFITK